MENSYLIEADNLAYKINEVKLFTNFSFSLKAGEALHIQGSNGSGKSTLIRILCGITPPSKGKVSKKNGLAFSYLGHKNALKTYLSVRDNISLLGLSQHESLKLFLLSLDLLEKLDVIVANLSFGQQKKVALLRIFLTSADLILLDEPFVGLDSTSHDLLCKFLEKKLNTGAGLVYTSHIPTGISSKNIVLD
ncbi:heme ABC exporter ATP-binding protein CcmA [Gammaproteobacteria bacterium]|nr:heme ABC exporter ATP-binding protein CcmA [Gammaproteobacteria bacterium]